MSRSPDCFLAGTIPRYAPTPRLRLNRVGSSRIRKNVKAVRTPTPLAGIVSSGSSFRPQAVLGTGVWGRNVRLWRVSRRHFHRSCFCSGVARRSRAACRLSRRYRRLGTAACFPSTRFHASPLFEPPASLFVWRTRTRAVSDHLAYDRDVGMRCSAAERSFASIMQIL
jgi:hypothetical protein